MVRSVEDFLEVTESKDCKIAIRRANKVLERWGQKKEFIIPANRTCPTPQQQSRTLTDLVIVIDTSGSMNDEAQALSQAAESVINNVQQKCPSDLRVKWFGIEGTWPNTRFEQKLRDYFHSLNIPDAEVRGRKYQDILVMAQEDGARAIEDIAYLFDWREQANRVIFYLGDEALEGGDPHEGSDVVAANKAIAAAQVAHVTVHTYIGTSAVEKSVIKAEYERVALDTGGEAFTAPIDLTGFEQALEKIICTSATRCQTIALPEILPCFQLHWGDGQQDRLETQDEEILYITAYNRYANVTFKDLTVVISEVTQGNGEAVPRAPDRETPAVFISPSMIHFGDLPPCAPQEQDELASISRELVFLSRVAPAGDYLFKIAYCYSIEFNNLQGVDAFQLQLVSS